MRSVDTNILVRWVTHDDPTQSVIADRILQTPVYVPLTILIELAWALSGEPYRMRREAINQALRLLVDLDTVTLPSEALVLWALDRHEAGADLADMVHIIESRGADSFISFERRLGKLAGPDAPVAVERAS